MSNNDRGRDYNRGGGGGGYSNQRDDRSRSRDRRDTGGRNFDRRDQETYGVGRGGFSGSRPSFMMVKTNYFRLEFDDPDNATEWIRYKVKINPAVIEKEFVGEEGSKRKAFKLNTDGSLRIVPKIRTNQNEALSMDIDTSSEISRRILRKLSEKIRAERQGAFMVSDGTGSAYSLIDFLGPSKLDETFQVKVKKDCDDDDEVAPQVKNSWFLVKLTKDKTKLKIIPGENILEEMRQAIDIVMKGAMTTLRMTAFGRSPRVFYFPEDRQRNLLDGCPKLKDIMDENRTYMPLLGIFQAVRFAQDGNMYLNVDTIVDYANRDKLPPENRLKVPLLDNVRGRFKICGVEIPGVNRSITDQTTRNDIEAAMRKIGINMEYKNGKVPPRELIDRWKEKGFTDAQIDKKQYCISRNKKMRRDEETKTCIIWSASDPQLYSFEIDNETKDGTIRVTVAEYYMKRRNIRIRFPHMPIVYLGDCKNSGGWFPIEFLFQAFGKMKDANEEKQKNAILNFYDQNAGPKRVEQIQRAYGNLRHIEGMGLTLEHILRQFNLRVNATPIEVEARVLNEPKLSFGNQSASIRNGSWNLRNVKFATPARLDSFAVADFSAGKGGNQLVDTFVNMFLRVANSHGMDVPSGNVSRLVAKMESRRVGGSQVDDTIKTAISNAKSYFLHESNEGWFKTRVKNPEGGFNECLYLPNGGIILDMATKPETHTFEYSGQKMEGRLCIKTPNGDIVDPFKYEYDKLSPNDTFVFQLEDYSILLCNQCDNEAPIIRVSESDIQCPSIIFCILPDNKAELYGLVKMFCHFYYGVQSQCIVADKYGHHKTNKEQYCSNVALKVNAKLCNLFDLSRGWSTKTYGGAEGITWVGEVPTLVMGISVSNSIGGGDVTVSIITASACLDPGCMQFAQEVRISSKTEIIAGEILRDLVKNLTISFYLRTFYAPLRIVVYRDGVSEGSFSRVQQCEIKSIREGYSDFITETGFKDIGNKVPVTFVACMSRTNVKIVPSNLHEGVKKNVHSGTCVDSVVTDRMTNLQLHGNKSEDSSTMEDHYIYSEPGGAGYDFLLTAHGGLKGTSKPVHYRIILNENAVWHPKDSNGTALTKDKLEQMTYEMCFQYQTATKTVRLVPVVLYSARLSEMVLKYFTFLDSDGSDGELVKKLMKATATEEEFQSIGRDGVTKPRYVYTRPNITAKNSKSKKNESVEEKDQMDDNPALTILPFSSPTTTYDSNGKASYLAASFTHLSL